MLYLTHFMDDRVTSRRLKYLGDLLDMSAETASIALLLYFS